ncbi:MULTISPECIES: aminomethyl-transferring glycine dehydrogenase subunit GcvPA [Brevibacillus]|uniref:Probable glycine dehydrogenase (decarboxylating) subunit 1 n=1 Tax=Brevibacillus centrosporus TaxID=54910 RepID=A0A1I3U5H9_9BACL|nr:MULTISPECIES: aminomethyl-transferring glycine dehydrogenase subunit GcvPA [Brevibacillus]MDR7314139.1 glycine dehydrogenase subunit 1 [Brevibacillus nitrificans]MEC2132588.1 aminomethyl-transferring glycine dehydrogenase subunit GcvPA [Brevibacillus centrosporus]MED1950707.1 aminomethyl-transferring glycine dehydrogenase subunit GcvPA [Brevibacillus centrosporus]MED4908686.1 aminomethyl-transferring glycine dehydrogenase subunit GcvPA [Brevibacillus centrosporus]RNB69666.1 aminomethyl-tran
MKYRYLPQTDQDKREMLETLGISSIEELFSDIPEEVRFKGALQIPEALSEPELVKYFTGLSNKNVNFSTHVNFLGAGVYQHYTPSTVNHMLLRGEFFTAYTPYQPEISQGELQAIFEFQTMVCELTGMEVANSSMYDGATSLAEAAMMAAGHTGKKRVIVSRAVHPEARGVLKTYAYGQNVELVEVGINSDGVTDPQALEALINDSTAAVIVQYPNFFGNVEDLSAIESIAHGNGALLITSSNPLALGVLEAPGKLGADIVVGDMQPFGIPASFGGPHCGYFATTTKLMRKMPGRIVGQTKDENGKRGFVLTLQAREQHIRREKATSNICSNQALLALAASITMTALGKQGVQEMAMMNLQKAHYAKQALQAKGLEVVFASPFFNEFAVKLSKPVAEVNKNLLAAGIIGGYDLGLDYPEFADHMLLAVTELRTKEEIDQLAQELEAITRA